jgi:hypothetical protein
MKPYDKVLLFGAPTPYFRGSRIKTERYREDR